MSERKITHVIFDVDGLLLDTEKLYDVVTQDIVGPYGKTFDWSVKVKMMGRPPPQSSQILVDELKLPITNMQFLEKAKVGFAKAFPTADLMPGVEHLVCHLHNHCIPMALATGSATRDYDAKITRHRDLFQLFDHVVTGDDPDLKNGKPAPDVFLIAASRFKTVPLQNSHVLVFEDAPNGIAAARSAGMWTVMVPDARIDPEMTKDAHVVLKTLDVFDPLKWGLPGF